jgi:hypothetical protein
LPLKFAASDHEQDHRDPLESDRAYMLQTAPDRAAGVREADAAFFAERYSDERLVADLDHFLFHRESAARAAA